MKRQDNFVVRTCLRTRQPRLDGQGSYGQKDQNLNRHNAQHHSDGERIGRLDINQETFGTPSIPLYIMKALWKAKDLRLPDSCQCMKFSVFPKRVPTQCSHSIKDRTRKNLTDN